MINYENRIKDIFIRKCKGFNFSEHIHYNVEILICSMGEIEVSCYQKKYILKKGMAFISFPNQVHSYRTINKSEVYIVIVSPDLLPNFNKKFQNYHSNIANVGEKLIELAISLYEEYNSQEQFEAVLGYLFIIMSKIVGKLKYIPTKNTNTDDTLSKALEYISNNYKTDITLKSVSAKVGVDISHMSRLFSQKLSCTFKNYILNLRIEYSKQMLLNSNDKITSIASESGFTSIRTFNRAFKAVTNMTPQEYRENGGN